MRKLIVAVATAGVMMLGGTAANLAVTGTANANALAQNLCVYVQGNDRLRMRERLREERIQLRRVYDSIMCNGQSLLQFAMSSGADDIGEYIVSQLPGSTIEAMGDLEWAESNGYGDSAIAAAIRERIGS
ncbi:MULTISPECIES: DUF3718 domain-containing protein [Gammaproteobacteria]|uniref:DUF3718 domain-containing protein n=1 Tax=Gammaproteobacteria TaxID=1236 RepID=UPI001A9FE1C8|nr:MULTISPECIES: DUF3718 domain-containing protein [Gammaproteobacteria]